MANQSKKYLKLAHVPSKSESSPSAQSQGLCVTGKGSSSMLKTVVGLVNEYQYSTNVVEVFICLLFDTGVRITEALRIRPSDVLRHNKIRIRGLKGSNDRIVSISYNRAFWQRYSVSCATFDDMYNRWFFYREFKKKGLYEMFGNNQKAAVTHLYRHLYALELDSENIEIELIKNSIGHKSTKSTEYYVKKGKGL